MTKLNTVYIIALLGVYMNIGKKIKQIRLQRALTQEELADRCELTKGYISQLENDLCSPSIATLIDILNVLGVSLQEFFTESKDEKIVFKKDDFFTSVNGSGITTWLIPNSQKNEMEPIILTLPPMAESEERLPFEGEEFGYVLQGKVAVVTDAGKYVVKEKEAFYLNGKRQHKIVNESKNESRMLWITTPSNF